MSDHARLAPSSASRRMACPGSLKFIESLGLPESEEHEAAAEGTLAHAVAHAICTGAVIPDGATDEMLEGAVLWAEHTGGEGEYEHKLSIESIHPECWGTVDHFRVVGNVIHVSDYKFGHKFVDAFENWQLLNYAAGVLQVVPHGDEDLLSLSIVQPRCFAPGGPIRTWLLSVAEAKVYFQQLRENAIEATSGTPELRPSPSACYMCQGRLQCPAFVQTTYRILEVAKFGDPQWSTGISEMASELLWLEDAQEMLKHRVQVVTETLIDAATKGVRVPNWQVEHGQTRRKWAATDAEIKSLEGKYNVKLLKEEAITPAQAIKAGVPAEEVNMMSFQQPGKATLKRTNFRKIFN